MSIAWAERENLFRGLGFRRRVLLGAALLRQVLTLPVVSQAPKGLGEVISHCEDVAESGRSGRDTYTVALSRASEHLTAKLQETRYMAQDYGNERGRVCAAMSWLARLVTTPDTEYAVPMRQVWIGCRLLNAWQHFCTVRGPLVPMRTLEDFVPRTFAGNTPSVTPIVQQAESEMDGLLLDLHRPLVTLSSVVLDARSWQQARCWQDGMVLKVARTIYEERRWQELPVLADALEDADLPEYPFLEHLRGPGPHARGCWALDLILEKA